MLRDGKFSYVYATIGGHGKKNNLSKVTVKRKKKKKRHSYMLGLYV